MIEVVLNAYSANKATKEYFEFFINPDVDKLYERFSREISKEILRGKHNRSTARISRIRKSIKDFESFNPGAERVRDLRLQTVGMLVEAEKTKTYTDTLIRGTLKLLNDTILYADKHLIFDSSMHDIDIIVAEHSDRSRHFRAFLKRNLELPDSKL